MLLEKENKSEKHKQRQQSHEHHMQKNWKRFFSNNLLTSKWIVFPFNHTCVLNSFFLFRYN